MNREIKERTKWFMDARFGMFIHWGLYSIPACGEWVMSQKEMTIEEYRKYFEQFDPWIMIQNMGSISKRSGNEICSFNGETSRWFLFI